MIKLYAVFILNCKQYYQSYKNGSIFKVVDLDLKYDQNDHEMLWSKMDINNIKSTIWLKY